MKVAVLVSGSGTNLQALLDAARTPDFPAEIVLVGCNRAEAAAIGRAHTAGVPVTIADREVYPRRADRQRRLFTPYGRRAPSSWSSRASTRC